jgi:hypothetical protein
MHAPTNIKTVHFCKICCHTSRKDLKISCAKVGTALLARAFATVTDCRNTGVNEVCFKKVKFSINMPCSHEEGLEL